MFAPNNYCFEKYFKSMISIYSKNTDKPSLIITKTSFIVSNSSFKILPRLIPACGWVKTILIVDLLTNYTRSAGICIITELWIGNKIVNILFILTGK